MLPVIAAILAFITIGGLGWAFVGGDDSSAEALKRAKTIQAGKQANPAGRRATQANTPEARRKQIMLQLREADRRERKARMTLSARMAQAGLTPNLRMFWILSGVAAVLGLLLPLMLGAPPLIALGLTFVAGFGLPRWVLGFMAKSRMKKFSGEFANAVDVIVRGIKSGLPVHDCFKIIARESPAPLGPEFQRLVEAVGVGMTLGQALDKMYERMPAPELRFLSIVMAIQQKTGGNLAEALGNLTVVLRARRMMREKIKALSSEAISSAGIIGSLPLVVMGLVMVASPDYMGRMFTDPRGHIMLMGSAVWMGMGVLVMKKMIAFKI
ncbi:type II secretion system F family protein [Brevundimonas balnearis]|uniref:Type II secretion system F family protein n=1 Tax=Brevundimonas balnearis TaxID=1572858 RepID=A0ABV6R4A3_9CAUL